MGARRDRIVWAWLARLWPAWRSSLLMVEPATVLAWHRRGFQLYWRWKSWVSPAGRPPLDQSLQELIRRMVRENPTWGRRRIQAELALLGYTVCDLTVAKYMRRRSPRPSPIDFFLVPTLTFRLLFAFIVLRHDRRQLLHVNVTDHPTAAWAAQQIAAAFAGQTPPAYLLRDRDGVYGEVFQRRLAEMGIRQILIAPRAPWQNPFAERVIGSIRRECLDHVVVLGERHLRRRLRAYQRYYNTARPHQALDNNSP
jgi:transposase InsO family protein